MPISTSHLLPVTRECPCELPARRAFTHTLLSIFAFVLIISTTLVPADLTQAQCPIHQTARILGAEGVCGLNGCRFGFSVALSADGSTALVGAYGDNNFIGSAYVYVRAPGGTTWVQQGPKLTPTGGVGAAQYFGGAVALSADGNTAIVGAYADSNSIGAIYAFTREAGVWTQQGPKLTPTGAIGALEYFGFSVALSADGNTALIGAEGDAGYIGAAYVFARSDGVWSQQARLTGAGGIGVVQYFGSAIAISGDGNTVAVGAYGDNNYIGAAYFYLRVGTIWAQQGPKRVASIGVSIPQYFGSAVALNFNGNTALVGAFGDNNFIGAVYNYNRFGIIWLEQQKFLPVGGSGQGRYGSTVSISTDGNTAIVGAPSDNNYTGAAYICSRPVTTAGWGQPRPKLVPTDGVGAGSFGSSVALNALATVSLVGAFGDSGAVGAAYVLSGGCAADFNCSGNVNVQDIFDFLSAWFAGDPRGNFNTLNGITVQDIFDFLTVWFTGCA